ncbi:MAG: UvrD-helicase domain-containing protein [Candidatus Magasanikbacteria bacterium]|nr:UvrD-helicase domain-containing protein [Candidatus Magasanikbacteria bacterium]
MIDFAKELNPEQLEAVLHGDGPCLVLAGAGSGKTRVITYRVAYLLEQGIGPENILLVTFTNKAADEMVRRMQQLTGSESRLPWAGTFHHIAYRILKIYAPVLGYKSNFTILDSDDSETILKLCAKPFKDTGRAKFPSARVLQNIISFARNSETTIADVLDLKFPQWMIFADEIKSVAHEYELKKKEANAMDFDDLLVNFLALLNNESVLKKYAEQFIYILVDEYQDTNKIQSSIIKKLAIVHGNLLVVGDDAQSIYSFRAADIANILQFEKQYPNAKVFKLETNYRSSQEILQVANDVIVNNVKQYKKELKTISKGGQKPSLHPQMDQGSEAEFVVSKILELIDKGVPPNDIAVLFRASHHSQLLEMELVKAGIAYDYRGGLRFFERAHVKDVLAYLRILNNITDTAAWMRVLMHEEGIGAVAASKIVEALKKATNIEDIKIIGQEVLGQKAKNGWNNFVRIWESMLSNSRTDTAGLIASIIDSPYKEYVQTEYIDSKDRLEDIAQLQMFAQKYNELEQFLAEATLQEGFNRGTANQNKDQSGPKVVLSTIHQAKGLEWSAVFIINLASGAFPSDRALQEENGLEEERRLFYVAITRAKKHLHLSYPMAGGWGDSMAGPSLFLGEISSDLIEDHSLLSSNGLVLDDEDAGVHYESEDRPLKIKPGSFLRSLDDL